MLGATQVSFEFNTYPAGDDCLADSGVALPPETLQAALEAEAVLFGSVGHSAADVLLPLRWELGAFANLRPSRAYKA